MSEIQYISGEEVGLIDGKPPASKEEWRLAVSFTKYKLEYDYQVPVLGGSQVRGGFIIDFVVSNPFQIPVEMMGQYWHSGVLGAGDRLRLAILTNLFDREPVEIWDFEVPDQDAADRVVRREFLG